jgi:hypothetical protein
MVSIIISALGFVYTRRGRIIPSQAELPENYIVCLNNDFAIITDDNDDATRKFQLTCIAQRCRSDARRISKRTPAHARARPRTPAHARAHFGEAIFILNAPFEISIREYKLAWLSKQTNFHRASRENPVHRRTAARKTLPSSFSHFRSRVPLRLPSVRLTASTNEGEVFHLRLKSFVIPSPSSNAPLLLPSSAQVGSFG